MWPLSLIEFQYLQKNVKNRPPKCDFFLDLDALLHFLKRGFQHRRRLRHDATSVSLYSHVQDIFCHRITRSHAVDVALLRITDRAFQY
jgi:hypothetical protein